MLCSLLEVNNFLGPAADACLLGRLGYMLTASRLAHLTVILQQRCKNTRAKPTRAAGAAHLYTCWWFYPGWPLSTQFCHICEDRNKEKKKQDQRLRADWQESATCTLALLNVPGLPTGAHMNMDSVCEWRIRRQFVCPHPVWGRL